MNDFVLALRQVRYQNRSFWRNPTVAFFTFLLPLIFLVILNALLGNNIRQLPGGQAELAYFYVPSMVALSIVIAFGAIFYGVDLPARTLPAFVLSVAVGAAAFSALGVALASFTPNAEAAPAVANATVLPILFVSDVFIRLDDPPRWLAVLGDIFPVKHLS